MERCVFLLTFQPARQPEMGFGMMVASMVSWCLLQKSGRFFCLKWPARLYIVIIHYVYIYVYHIYSIH